MATSSLTSSTDMARTLVAALLQCGVRDVVYSPGSRCAPFAFALAEAEERGDCRVLIRLDERSAAFTAVGLSRAGVLEEGGRPRPVAIVGTSGGAIAQYHAGVAEASHSDIPVIVVSADRPFEMRGVGASQTTQQPGIFAEHCRGVWDIPAGQAADHRIAAVVSRAVACAEGTLGSRPGPVQINVGLRDPLAPSVWPLPEPPAPFSLPRPERAEVAPAPWEDVVDTRLRTVMIAGDGAPPQAGVWADDAGVPLLAEPSSGLMGAPTWVPFQQSFLQADNPLAARIEQVVVVGRPTLSRPVSALLARDDIRLIVVARHHEWVDVAGRARTIVHSFTSTRAKHEDTSWLSQWREAGEQAICRLQPLLDGELSLLNVASTVWGEPAECLMLGASNSIRAVDLVAQSAPPCPVVSNRGLAGIDGTIATAMGLSWGSNRPVRALMGDLTFLHDASSLAVTDGDSTPDVQIIVVDDQGGGIFDSLEYSASHLRSLYHRWFDTSQPTRIDAIAQAYGATYTRLSTIDDLREHLDKPFSGLNIVHLPIQRPTQLLAQVKKIVQP